MVISQTIVCEFSLAQTGKSVQPFSPFNLQTDNFRLHYQQTVNGLGKIAWASVFRFLFNVYIFYISIHICICISLYIYAFVSIYICMYIRKTEVCFPQSKVDRRLLFQQRVHPCSLASRKAKPNICQCHVITARRFFLNK